MIKSTNILSAKTKYEVECDICKTTLTKEILKSSSISEVDSKLSTTETALCDTCKPKFIKWVREKYPKDCWCKHLTEYKKLQSKISEVK